MPEKCNEANCPLIPRVEALERDSEHNKEAHKEFYGKLEGSNTAVALINERMNQIKEDTEEIKETVREMKDKPGKRWDGMVDKLIWGIVGVLAGAAGSTLIQLLKMGLNA